MKRCLLINAVSREKAHFAQGIPYLLKRGIPMQLPSGNGLIRYLIAVLWLCVLIVLPRAPYTFNVVDRITLLVQLKEANPTRFMWKGGRWIQEIPVENRHKDKNL